MVRGWEPHPLDSRGGPGDCTQGMGGHGTWCIVPIGWEGPGRWRVTVGMVVQGIAPERWEGTAHWVGDDPIDHRTRWWVTVSMVVQGIVPERWEEGHRALGVAPVQESSVAPVGWEGATAERHARWGSHGCRTRGMVTAGMSSRGPGCRTHWGVPCGMGRGPLSGVKRMEHLFSRETTVGSDVNEKAH